MDDTTKVAVAVTTISLVCMVIGIRCLLKGLSLRGRTDVVYVQGFHWVASGITLTCSSLGGSMIWVEALRSAAGIIEVFAMLGVVLCFMFLHRIIEFTDDTFSHKPLFGRKKIFRYDEVVGHRHYIVRARHGGSRREHGIYTKTWHIALQDDEQNVESFFKALEDGYRRAHDGAELPIIEDPRTRTQKAARFFACFAVTMLIFSLIIRLASWITPDVTAMELQTSQVTFQRLHYVGFRSDPNGRYDTEIITDQGSYFITGAWDKTIVRETVKCGDPLTIRWYTNYEGTDRYAEIVYADNVQLVFPTNNARERKEMIRGWSVGSMMFGCVFGVVAFAVSRKAKNRGDDDDAASV